METQMERQITNDLNSPGLPGPVTFDYPDFSSVEGLALVGSAARNKNVRDGLVLRLTAATYNQLGSAWYERKAQVSLGFTTSFCFRISEPGALGGGADGFSFNVQNAGTDQNVGEWSAFNHLGIRFETFNDNSIYIFNLGAQLASHNLDDLLNMKDGSAYEVQITVSPKMRLSLSIGRTDEPRLPNSPMVEVISNLPIQLAQISPAYVGFGGRTGAGIENHDILRWSFQCGSSTPR